MKDDRGDLDLTKQIEDLKKKVREAEGETFLLLKVLVKFSRDESLKSRE
jgi:hypothetical protein